MKVCHTFVFLKKFLEDISPFVGPQITLFWTSGDVSSGLQSQSGQPYSCLAEVYVLYIFLRFTFGVTPVDFLVANMTAELISSTHL